MTGWGCSEHKAGRALIKACMCITGPWTQASTPPFKNTISSKQTGRLTAGVHVRPRGRRVRYVCKNKLCRHLWLCDAAQTLPPEGKEMMLLSFCSFYESALYKLTSLPDTITTGMKHRPHKLLADNLTASPENVFTEEKRRL